MSTAPSWRSESRKIADLVPAKYNPRKLTEEQEKQLTASIVKFDVCDPIIINSDNTIIGGHQRIKILSAHGVESVDVRVPSRQLSINEEKELNLRLNKNLGEWDFELLKDLGIDMLKEVGFDTKDLDVIFRADPDEKDDAVPDAMEETTTQVGDIFQLGRHRVMCGDSTDAGSVAVLMDGKKADMVFTDPPYGVSYADKNKFLNAISPGNRIQVEIENDHHSDKETQDFWLKVFEVIRDNLADVNSYYITGPQIHGMMMMMMMMKAGLPYRHVIIWVKNNHVLGRCDYHYRHEPIFFGWTKTHKFIAGGDFKTSVWDIDKPLKNDLHPTMKPVELIENALRNSSDREDICLDVFLGSGSTVIACEKTNRICYGMEIDPHYVDVIVKRWEDYTGQKAIKL